MLQSRAPLCRTCSQWGISKPVTSNSWGAGNEKAADQPDQLWRGLQNTAPHLHPSSWEDSWEEEQHPTKKQPKNTEQKKEHKDFQCNQMHHVPKKYSDLSYMSIKWSLCVVVFFFLLLPFIRYNTILLFQSCFLAPLVPAQWYHRWAAVRT